MTSRYLEGKGRCFVLFLLCFIVYSLVYMTKNIFSTAMASIVEAGIMTKSQTGAISAAYWLAYAPFQVIGGFAADKYSPAKLVCIGVGGSAIASLLIYFNQSYPVMMAVWIFNAIIQFGLWPSIFRIVATQVSPKYRDKSIFWILFSTSFGLGLSMLMASFVTNWVNNFLYAFFIQIVALVAFILIYRQLDRHMVESEEELPATAKNPKTEFPKINLGKLFLASGLVVILVINFLRCMIDNGIKNITPTMLMESYDTLPAALATRLSIILIISSAIGVFLAGIVQKRITSHEVKALTLMLSVGLPALLLSCLIGRVHYLWMLLFLAIAVMFLHGAGPFAASFTAKRFIPYGKSATVSGIVNAAAALANVLASFLFAKMAESLPWHVITLSWLISILIATLAGLFIMRTWTRFISLHKSR